MKLRTTEQVIERSALSADGKVVAKAVAHSMLAAADFDVAFDELDDRGAALEFVAPATGRDLIFAVPEDGTRRYFAARGPGFRASGIVLDEAAIPALATWATDESAQFPASGLVLSRGSAGRHPGGNE